MADVMTVCAKLNQEQRETIIARFCNLNPSHRGAAVEDIIDILDNSDSNLDAVEEAWERFPRLQDPGFGSAIRALVWSGTDVSADNIELLLTHTL